MSQYERQCDYEKAICPYCEHGYEVESEDYDEERRKEECEECGKTFWLSQSFSVTHDTSPDCELNEDTHKWELMSFSDLRTAFFCAKCNKCSLVAGDGTPLFEKKKEQAA
jgi:transposase-like protein